MEDGFWSPRMNENVFQDKYERLIAKTKVNIAKKSPPQAPYLPSSEWWSFFLYLAQIGGRRKWSIPVVDRLLAEYTRCHAINGKFFKGK